MRHTREFVEAHLNLERLFTVLFVHFEILVEDERDLLVWCLGAHDVSQGNVLEAVVLADIVVVGALGEVSVSTQ